MKFTSTIFLSLMYEGCIKHTGGTGAAIKGARVKFVAKPSAIQSPFVQVSTMATTLKKLAEQFRLAGDSRAKSTATPDKEENLDMFNL